MHHPAHHWRTGRVAEVSTAMQGVIVLNNKVFIEGTQIANQPATPARSASYKKSDCAYGKDSSKTSTRSLSGIPGWPEHATARYGRPDQLRRTPADAPTCLPISWKTQRFNEAASVLLPAPLPNWVTLKRESSSRRWRRNPGALPKLAWKWPWRLRRLLNVPPSNVPLN
jgi:hypothetical protein